jgi:hypothetical protein
MLHCNKLLSTQQNGTRMTPMMTQAQTELVDFLKSEASAAMARACRSDIAAHNDIAEAQELLALRARLLARHAPAFDVAQMELPFLRKAA